ncbi:unnamed protein product [Urochloa humidicola]
MLRKRWHVPADLELPGLVRDQNSATTSNTGNVRCRRLPSGCVMQDTPNGNCKMVLDCSVLDARMSFRKIQYQVREHQDATGSGVQVML